VSDLEDRRRRLRRNRRLTIITAIAGPIIVLALFVSVLLFGLR
jgi:hypothetical protein